MFSTLIKSKIYFLSYVILSRLFLDLCYFFYIVPIYSYQGFVNDFSIEKHCFSLLVTIFIQNFLKNYSFKPSNLFLLIMMAFVLLPIGTLYSFGVLDNEFFLKVNILLTLIFLLNNFNLNFTSSLKFSFISKFLDLKTFLILVVVLLYSKYGVNLNFNILNIIEPTDLYLQRSEYKSINIGYFSYLLSNFHNVLLPFIFGFSIYFRKKLLFLISSFTYIYIFLITSHKMIFFAPFLIIFSFLLLFQNNNSFAFNLRFFNYFLIFVSLSFVIDYLNFFEYPIFNSIIIRRMFFLPALIGSQYLEYFSVNGPTYFSDVFQSLSPFPVTGMANIIGRYFYQEGNYANTGFIYDSLTKAGLLSAILYIFILKIILSMMDSFSKNKNDFLVFCSIVIPFISLTNSSLSTTILTHGLLTSLVLIFLIPNERIIK